MKINQYFGDVSVEREFDCRYCGKHVVVTSAKDRRVVYCSQVCEKQYWREKSKRDAAQKNRSRESSGMKNYSNKEMAIKLRREKKESEEI